MRITLSTLTTQLWSMIHQAPEEVSSTRPTEVDLDRAELNEHALRDIGVLDGRISPSTARYHAGAAGIGLEALREDPRHPL